MCLAKYDVMLSLKLRGDQLEIFISLRHLQSETWTDPFWSGSPDAKGRDHDIEKSRPIVNNHTLSAAESLTSYTAIRQNWHNNRLPNAIQCYWDPYQNSPQVTVGKASSFWRNRGAAAASVWRSKRNLKLSTELIKRVENLRADVSSVRFVSYKN